MKLNLLILCVVPLVGQQPAPELSISANGARDVYVAQTWPLIVHATLLHSLRLSRYGDQPPLRIAPPGMSWTDAIQFTAVSSSGQPASWSFNLVGLPADPVLTLPNHGYVTAAWQMPAPAVSAIPAGTYQLMASLQVNGSDGWSGVAQSAPITIHIAPEPSPLSADQESQKMLLAAEFAINAGDLDSALGSVQGLLQSQPGNTDAMTTAASIFETRGYHGMAFIQVDAAVQAYLNASPAPGPPPDDLLIMHQQLLAEVLTPGVYTPVVSQIGAFSSGSPAPVTPGAPFSILGQNLSPAAAMSSDTPLPLLLGSTIVTVNDTPIPLSSVSPTRIEAQMPNDIQPGSANVIVFSGDAAGVPVALTVQPSAQPQVRR